MEIEESKIDLPGFPSVGCFVIEYQFKDGTQEDNQPNPGQPYKCEFFPRRAFLPRNPEGRKILK